MTYPHRIRLRGPWEAVPIDQGPAPPQRVTVPGVFAGRMRLMRKFGYPGRIDTFERVWLTVADVLGRAEFVLNGRSLGEGRSGSFEFDVTRLLAERNRLEVMLPESDPCELAGEIALEIRCAVYLHNVAASFLANGRLAVSGRVLGSWPDPLDLYVLIDGRNVEYVSVKAGPEPDEFRTSIPAEASYGQVVSVELVQGAVVWYHVDLPIG